MRLATRAATVLVGVAAAVLSLPGSASAQTEIGWTGSTPVYDGNLYLHNSSISNDAGIVARTKLWTATGATVAPGFLGVRARLFKSGVVCEVVGYRFNTAWTSTLESASTADCGPGSYNSHGFIKVNSSSGTHEFFTFPSNPLNFAGSASARSANSEDAVVPQDTVTVGDATYGPYNASDEGAQPDFVAAFTDSGEIGYVNSAALDAAVDSGTLLDVVSTDGAKIGVLTVR